MFFSSDLLIFKRGKFNLIWLAATRGDKFLSKKDLKMVDLNYACSEIMEYIMRHQKIKLSLYLSSQLTFGLCVIFHKKIDKLLIDLQDLYKKSLVTVTFNTTSSKPKGNKKSKDKRNETQISVLDEFAEINESFGILKNLENNTKENEMDLTNQIAYLNQARFEDITLMECDMGPSNLRNQLENDLEPMNMELLQELLGTADPNKNDIKAYLNEPFEINVEKVSDKFEANESTELKKIRMSTEVDLDRIPDYCEERAPNEISMNVTDKMEVDAEINVGIANGNVTDLKENLIDLPDLINNKRKVSVAIHTFEVEQSANRVASPIDLQYHRNRKDLKTPTNPKRPLKRKASRKALIVDEVTTISHQVIRDNMNKKSFGLVDKNTLFPNAYVAKSLKAQIACSAANLFEFPGSYMTLHCPKLLRMWMDQKERCRTTKSNFVDYETVQKSDLKDNTHKQELNYSDISIEKAREASSYNMNVPIDSFTFGSDSLQKSIHQSSFDADRTLEENNPRLPAEIVEEIVPNYSLEKSMMPIIEEDFNTKLEINNEIQKENKLLEKGDIWRIIQSLLKSELNNKNWNEVRISFTDICPKQSPKKVASIVFLTLLRLGKYGKIHLYQETSLAEIYIGLPSREI